MTQTTEAPAGTALAQVAPGVIAQVRGSKTLTMADLANLLAAPVEPVPQDADFPPPPKPVKFTDTLRKHLREISSLFGNVMPTERRRLERAEVRDLTEEANAIDVLVKELGARRKAISEFMRTHQDFQALDEGKPAERIAGGVAKGHILAATAHDPFETEVEGYAERWQQRFVSGSASPSQPMLQELLDAGTITQAEFNGFTRAVRVLDDLRVQEFIRKNPARGLQVLAAITTREAPSASLYAPKK